MVTASDWSDFAAKLRQSGQELQAYMDMKFYNSWIRSAHVKEAV